MVDKGYTEGGGNINQDIINAMNDLSIPRYCICTTCGACDRNGQKGLCRIDMNESIRYLLAIGRSVSGEAWNTTCNDCLSQKCRR